jgi:hypothetical protein
MVVKDRAFAGFSQQAPVSFDADGERRVSSASRVWFRKGGCGERRAFSSEFAINRKFTPNQISRSFREFSAI